MIRSCLLFCLLTTCYCLQAEPLIDRIHFLIPGGPGGGWDNTARGIGQAIQSSGLAAHLSYENLSGGGGGRAIAKLIETRKRQQNTLMVNSTPIVIRSLQNVFPQSFRDLTPVAALIADYSCFVVRADSPLMDWSQVILELQKNSSSIKVAGGSVRGSTDHLVLALAAKAAELKPRRIIYIPYDAGGKAMAGLLSGETQLLSTGLSETIDMLAAGEVRILAVAAESRLPHIKEVPTLRELGYDVVFANWRGFFGPPGLSEPRIEGYSTLFGQLLATPQFKDLVERNGWQVQYHSGRAFYSFLEHQEEQMGPMMRALGFLR